MTELHSLLVPTPAPSPRALEPLRFDMDSSGSCIGAEVGESLERMILVQLSAYPDDWSISDKREMAILHLFGASSSPTGPSSLRDRAPTGLTGSRFNPSRNGESA